jgi:hypothetical protein
MVLSFFCSVQQFSQVLLQQQSGLFAVPFAAVAHDFACSSSQLILQQK